MGAVRGATFSAWAAEGSISEHPVIRATVSVFIQFAPHFVGSPADVNKRTKRASRDGRTVTAHNLQTKIHD
jgi:hypothetical protein